MEVGEKYLERIAESLQNRRKGKSGKSSACAELQHAQRGSARIFTYAGEFRTERLKLVSENRRRAPSTASKRNFNNGSVYELNLVGLANVVDAPEVARS